MNRPGTRALNAHIPFEFVVGVIEKPVRLLETFVLGDTLDLGIATQGLVVVVVWV
jgi:hypothetical protein